MLSLMLPSTEKRFCKRIFVLSKFPPKFPFLFLHIQSWLGSHYCWHSIVRRKPSSYLKLNHTSSTTCTITEKSSWRPVQDFTRYIGLDGLYNLQYLHSTWNKRRAGLVISHKYYNQKQSSKGVLWKRMFLEISQNSQENTCARVSFLIKLQASGLQLY